MTRRLFVLLAVVLCLCISIVLAQTVIIKNPITNDSNFYLSLGNFLFGKGFNEPALAAYEKALRIEPENAEVLNNIGYFYRESNPLLSEEYFLKALTFKPDYETARNNLAILYNRLFLYDKAEKELRVLVNKHPENIHYNYDLAINIAQKFRFQSGNLYDINEALKFFKVVYKIDPGFGHVLENIEVLDDIRRLG